MRVRDPGLDDGRVGGEDAHHPARKAQEGQREQDDVDPGQLHALADQGVAGVLVAPPQALPHQDGQARGQAHQEDEDVVEELAADPEGRDADPPARLPPGGT